MTEAQKPMNMKTFTAIWFGQLVSLIGTGITRFGLGVYVYQETGSVTQFALIALSKALPGLFLAPFAGVVVDRFDRRKVMIFSDLGAGFFTLLIFLLLQADNLQVWHIYLIVAGSVMCDTFQGPAFNASVSMLVPREMLGRANGMLQFTRSAGLVTVALAAGYLVVTLGLKVIVIIDFATFIFATIMLLFVKIPNPEKTGRAGGLKAFYNEALAGWRYLTDRPQLMLLLISTSLVGLGFGFTTILITPMLLEMTTADMLGVVLSISGASMVVSSSVIIKTGGPKRRVRGVFMFTALMSLGLMIQGIQPNLIVVCIGTAVAAFSFPVMNTCSQFIWQTRIPFELQGRVFSLIRVIGSVSTPISALLAGPLAESLFEPMLMEGGNLAGSVGSIIGTGPGRGIALIFLLVGLNGMIISAWALRKKPLVNLEQDIPPLKPPGPPRPPK